MFKKGACVLKIQWNSSNIFQDWIYNITVLIKMSGLD